MSASNWLEIEILNHIFGKVPYIHKGMYFGLGLNTIDSAANELADEYGYVRLMQSTAYWTQATAGSIVNTLQITMAPVVGGDWGSVTHFILFNSALQTGQMLLYGHFDPELVFVENDLPQFEPGELEITLD